jgi:collagen type VII alpha
MSIINLFTSGTTKIDPIYFPINIGPTGPTGSTGDTGLIGNTGIQGPTGPVKNIYGITGTGYLILGQTGNTPMTYSYNTNILANSTGMLLNNPTNNNNTILTTGLTGGRLLVSDSITGITGIVYDTKYNPITTTYTGKFTYKLLYNIPNAMWQSCVISQNEQYIVACYNDIYLGSQNYGKIYFSNNSNNTYTFNQIGPTGLWTSVAMSRSSNNTDGKYISAVQGGKILYTSNNYGIGMTGITEAVPQDEGASYNFTNVAISSDGINQYVGSLNEEYLAGYDAIYNSTNNNWTVPWYNISGNTKCPVINGNNLYYYIKVETPPKIIYNISGNTGEFIVNGISALSASSTLQYITYITNNNIFITSSGNTSPSFTQIASPSSRGLSLVTVSSTGNTQAVMDIDGYIYISNNNGNTWNGITGGIPIPNATSMSISNNTLIVTDSVGNIWMPIQNSVSTISEEFTIIGIGDILNNNNNVIFNPINNISSIGFGITGTTMSIGMTGGTLSVADHIGNTGIIYDTYFNKPLQKILSFNISSAPVQTISPNTISKISEWTYNSGNSTTTTTIITYNNITKTFNNNTNFQIILQVTGSIQWNNVSVTTGLARNIWIQRSDSTSTYYGYNSISANTNYTVQNFSTTIILNPIDTFSIYAWQNSNSGINIMSQYSRLDIVYIK